MVFRMHVNVTGKNERVTKCFVDHKNELRHRMWIDFPLAELYKTRQRSTGYNRMAVVEYQCVMFHLANSLPP